MADIPEASSIDLSTELWMIGNDIKISARLDRIMLRDKTLGVLNIDELWRAESDFAIAANRLFAEALPVPPDFPPARLALPESGFAPDYFKHHGYIFVSRMLREALAQPEDVVQFTSMELVAGGKAARAQNYRLMRVIAKQPALDLYLSDCSVHEFVNPIDGERSMRTDFVSHFALLEGLQPLTEIFRTKEEPTCILVTDRLAERVLRADCTGIAFGDPTNPYFTDEPSRYRGKNGAVMR